MSIGIAIKAQELVQDVQRWEQEVLAAVGGNVSANQRARKMSVMIRASMKELRFELLDLEKSKKK